MILTVEIPDDTVRRLQSFGEKDWTLYQESVQQYAAQKAERLAAMTGEERKEYKEISAAIAESEAQYERGEYMTWEEAKARSDRELAVLIAQEKALQ